MKKSAFPAEIKGRRVILRKHRTGTAGTLFAAVDKDRARLGKFLPWVRFTKSVADSRKFISTSLEKWRARSTFNYAIFLKSNGAFVGTISFLSIEWDDACGEIGYWIAREFEGQGLMSDAVGALEAVCFKKGFYRIEIRCDARNKKSAAIPQRRGYKLEGHLRGNKVSNGTRRDTLIFGKIRR